MIDPKQALFDTARYLKQHPEEILRQLRNSSRFRLGLPVAALQWLANRLGAGGRGGPTDVEITAAPPGIRLKATVEQMGTQVRADCVIIIESVRIDATKARVELRLSNVTLALVDESVQTPLAALIRSGTLDVSRLASLVAYMPARPPALVEAVDDRIVLDLMKIPRLARDERLRRWIGGVFSVIAVESIASEAEHVDVALKALPRGLSGVLGRD